MPFVLLWVIDLGKEYDGVDQAQLEQFGPGFVEGKYRDRWWNWLGGEDGKLARTRWFWGARWGRGSSLNKPAGKAKASMLLFGGEEEMLQDIYVQLYMSLWVERGKSPELHVVSYCCWSRGGVKIRLLAGRLLGSQFGYFTVF